MPREQLRSRVGVGGWGGGCLLGSQELPGSCAICRRWETPAQLQGRCLVVLAWPAGGRDPPERGDLSPQGQPQPSGVTLSVDMFEDWLNPSCGQSGTPKHLAGASRACASLDTCPSDLLPVSFPRASPLLPPPCPALASWEGHLVPPRPPTRHRGRVAGRGSGQHSARQAPGGRPPHPRRSELLPPPRVGCCPIWPPCLLSLRLAVSLSPRLSRDPMPSGGGCWGRGRSLGMHPHSSAGRDGVLPSVTPRSLIWRRRQESSFLLVLLLWPTWEFSKTEESCLPWGPPQLVPSPSP